MPERPFTGEMFKATPWSTSEDKAQFGNQLLRFIEEGFPKGLFTKALYGRLSQCFQHIAHCDLYGFYVTWFSTPGNKARFLAHILRSPCFGDPAYTYSDVEREIQNEVRRRNYLALYRLQAIEAERSEEVKLLERLEVKYRQPSQQDLENAASAIHPKFAQLQPSERRIPLQQMLF